MTQTESFCMGCQPTHTVVGALKMEDRKMQDQLSFICTHYTYKTVTVKKTHKNAWTAKSSFLSEAVERAVR